MVFWWSKVIPIRAAEKGPRQASGIPACSGRTQSGMKAGPLRYPGQKKPSAGRILRKTRASLTLEAAIAIPLFLFFLLAVMSFLMMLHIQMQVQSSMEEAVRKMGKSAYLIEQADHVLSGTGSRNGTAGDKASQLDSGTITLVQAGINSATMQLTLLSDSTLRKTMDGSRVAGGVSGLHTYASSYNPETGILDMVVCYDYRVPYLPGFLGNLRIVQRARCHAWVGDSLKEDGEAHGDSSHTVFVTPTGTVYHTSPDCHYLDLSIHSVPGTAVSGMRNASGARYYPCEECARGAAFDTVYITDYGTSYHSSLGCSGLKRTVQEKDIEEVEGMRMCTKCSQNGGHGHTH